MVIKNVNLEIVCGITSKIPDTAYNEVAFAGKSNVGKSSVINRLLNRKNFARVGSQPGKTVHVNYFLLDKTCYLVDLPGYGFAKRSGTERAVFSDLVDAYLTGDSAPELVVQLIDLKTGPTSFDNLMLSFLNNTGIPYMVIATKADKLNKTEYEKMIGALDTHPLISKEAEIIPFSALKPTAAEEIRKRIFEFLDQN